MPVKLIDRAPINKGRLFQRSYTHKRRPEQGQASLLPLGTRIDGDRRVGGREQRNHGRTARESSTHSGSAAPRARTAEDASLHRINVYWGITYPLVPFSNPLLEKAAERCRPSIP